MQTTSSFVQTVCQDGGTDEADDDEQQVGTNFLNPSNVCLSI